MDIQGFKQALFSGGGPARPNRFEVEIALPAFAGGVEVSRKVKFLVKAAQIPASTIGAMEVPFGGRMLPIPGDRTFEPWTVQVVNTEDFAIRDALERWSNAINGNVSNVGLDQPEDYMRDIAVYQLSNNGARIKEYVMQDAWPAEVGTIELAMDTNDTVQEFPVTFRYSTWEANTTT